MQPVNCLNCGETLALTAKFCPSCGQKTDLHRLSLKELGHDAVHYVTHADKSIFSLLRDLATRTGHVAREFVEGRRKRHFPPLNFILIVAAICLLMTSIVFTYKPKTSYTRPSSSVSQTTKPQVYDPVQAKRMMNVGKFFAKYANMVSIIAIPIMSIVCWLLYARGRYNYTEHLVANMYMSGFILIFYALIFKPAELIQPLNQGYYLIGLYFLLEIVYRSIFYYHFINQKTKISAVKAVVVSLVVTASWIVLSSGAIAVYTRNGFWGLMD